MTFQEIKFDSRYIDICVESLLRLKKQKERYDLNEVWSLDILSRLNHLDHWSDDVPLLIEANNTLRSLAGVKDVLEYLLESLQDTTKIVTEALLPFQRGRGLASLPDDVLSMIFVQAGSKTTLDLVCRRFRQVASAIPQLWSSISNVMKSMRLVNASLEKSKAVGLEVDLDLESRFWNSQVDVFQFLDAAIVHIDRWEELHVSHFHATSWQELGPRITQMGEVTKNFHMPRLRTLSLYFYGGFPWDEGILDESDSVIHFYKTWSLPGLRHLQVNNFVPVPFAIPSLTSLSIKLGDPDPEEEYRNERRHSLLRLFHFLSSVPYLEVLELLLDGPLEDSDLPSLVLHHLKTFRIHCGVWVKPQVFCMPKALTTPAIRNMHLTVEDEFCPSDTDINLTPWLDNFLCHDTYPTLEEFTFECFNEDDCGTFNIPFTKLPNLRTLTLYTSNWTPSENNIFPPLLSLYLKGRVDNRWTYWLRNVRERMQEQGKLTDFQNLTIEVNDNLNKNLIERLFSKHRVVWR